jgi:hypothetical protein
VSLFSCAVSPSHPLVVAGTIDVINAPVVKGICQLLSKAQGYDSSRICATHSAVSTSLRSGHTKGQIFVEDAVVGTERAGLLKEALREHRLS